MKGLAVLPSARVHDRDPAIEREPVSMFGMRWMVGLGALLVAGLALYLVLNGTSEPGSETMREISRPALDNIDAKSRSAMRELLRDAENEE